MIPFVMRDAWWRSGLAGAIPSAVCFVLAGTFLFAAARRAYRFDVRRVRRGAAVRAEPEHAVSAIDAHDGAAVCGLARGAAVGDAMVSRFAIDPGRAARRGRLERRVAHALRRLVSDPVRVRFIFCSSRNDKWHAVLFGALAALAPLAWLAHNRFYYGNALEFYNGPWSAMAIYQRQLAQGMQPYPGDHDWRTALQYYFAAGRAGGRTGPFSSSESAGAVLALVEAGLVAAGACCC